MNRAQPGRYVTVSTVAEKVKAFVPNALPPRPPLDWAPELRARYDAALVALGRLDAVTELLPDSSLLLYSFIRKEAVLSSMIEGTASSLKDLLLWELDEQPGVPVDDAREVSSCVGALEHGLTRMRAGFPLSVRLLRELHERLLTGGRGAHLTPGELRKSQVWIGGTRPGNARFVPPPADRVPECLAALEKFLHDKPSATPPLLKAALSHVQFETIHPFLDGNGRVGRLLITLQLCAEGLLREPLLYLSLYFKEHRATYYDLLDRVRVSGDWEAWVEFFVDAVAWTANEAGQAARRLLAIAAEDQHKIEALGRVAASAHTVHRAMQRRPLATATSLAEMTGLTPATINKALSNLVRVGVVAELTQRRRGRVFSYVAYAAVLNEGMTLPGGKPA